MAGLDDVLHLVEVILLVIASILSILNQQKRSRVSTSVSLFLSMLVFAMMVGPHIYMLPDNEFWGIVAVGALTLSFAFNLGANK